MRVPGALAALVLTAAAVPAASQVTPPVPAVPPGAQPTPPAKIQPGHP